MVQSRVRSPVMPRTRAAGVSRASRVPWSMMATRSLRVAASSMSWVVMTTVVHEGPGDHHALDLTAREVVRPAAAPVTQPELLEQLVGQLLALSPRHAVIA